MNKEYAQQYVERQRTRRANRKAAIASDGRERVNEARRLRRLYSGNFGHVENDDVYNFLLLGTGGTPRG